MQNKSLKKQIVNKTKKWKYKKLFLLKPPKNYNRGVLF